MSKLKFKPRRQLKAVPKPVYYVRNAGSDSNDGLSWETAFLHVDKLEEVKALVGPKFEAVFEGGQYHRRSTAEDVPTLSLETNEWVTVADGPILRTHDGSQAWISGDFLINTGWSLATSGEVGAAGVTLGVEKRTMGAGYDWVNFPCIDDFMLQPAVWTVGGHPTSIHVWDASEYLSDGFHHYDPEGVSPTQTYEFNGPAAYDGVSEIQHWWDSGTEVRMIKFTHPAIAAHYGAVSPVGALVPYFAANVQTYVGVITAYNQGGSWIEVAVADEGSYGQPAAFPYWSIMCHPFDIRQVGQYAYSADRTVLFAKFPAGTNRSVARQRKGLYLAGVGWNVDGIAPARMACRTTQSAAMLSLRGSDFTFNNFTLKQSIDPDRGNCIEVTTGYTHARAEFTDFELVQNYHKSSWRLGNAIDWVIDGGEVRDGGRTDFYTSGNGDGTVFRNVNVPNKSAVHGQVNSNYPSSTNTTLEKIFALGCRAGISAQNYPGKIEDRGNKYLNSVFSGMRIIGTAKPGTFSAFLMRLDNSETNGEIGNMLLLDGAAGAFSDFEGSASNDGLDIHNLITWSFGFEPENTVEGTTTPASGTGVTMRDVLAYTSQYGGYETSDWSGAGGATLDAESKVDVSDPWTGSLSDQQWKYLTKNEDNTYSPVQLGPDAFNWIVPAYGDDIVLAPLKVDNTWVRNNYQAGKQICQVVCVPPKSTVTIPAGVNDSDLFDIERDRIWAKNTLTAGTYVLALDTDCPTATGPTTHRTLITITVRPNA